MSKKRLGKGLSALINNDENVDQSRVEEIFVDQIEPNPFQPRDNFDQEALNELALQTGVNIIYDESITGTITLDLEDVSLEKALDLILLKGGFYYQKVGSVYCAL